MLSNYEQDMERLVQMEPNPGLEYWEVIVKYSGDISRVESELGVEVEILGENFAIITLRSEQISRLYDFREIEYIELPKTLTLMLEQSMRTTCISTVHNMDEHNLKGQGVLVGLIDSGIDYTHADFRNQDGTSRILYIWDQTENGNPPNGFKQGTEYDNNQINMALNSTNPFEIVSSSDMVGHGTAVAGIAAGNGSESGGREKGAAPEAALIIVKLGFRGFESFARTTEIMRALKYILDRAEDLGMPVAINLSFGTNYGSHDGSSLFETYINYLALRWKTVIVAATGNEGAAGHHFSGIIAPMQTMDVNFVIANHVSTLYLNLWKDFTDRFSLELFLPGGESTGELNPLERFTTKNIGGISLQVYYGKPTHYNEEQEVFFRIRRQESAIPQGVWRLRVRGITVVGGSFDIWLPTVEEVGTDIAFTEPSIETTLTLPSTVKNVISVGGYNGALDAAAQFSGRGFTQNNVYVKPDLMAPAVGIITTSTGGGYDSFTGTSMAAPFVTGAAALLMQWGIVRGRDPFLYGQRVKAFLKRGADRNYGIGYPNPLWGWGTLCLRDSLPL